MLLSIEIFGQFDELAKALQSKDLSADLSANLFADLPAKLSVDLSADFFFIAEFRSLRAEPQFEPYFCKTFVLFSFIT